MLSRHVSMCVRAFNAGKFGVRGLPSARTMATNAAVRIDHVTEDGIAVIIFDDPESKVNTLSRRTMESFGEVMEKVQSDSAIRGAVLKSGKADNWIAGADVHVLDKLSGGELESLLQDGQSAMDAIEKSKKPIVAAIHGSCLGGGAEVALSCHYRVATLHPKTKLGFPEVQLGLLPGSGGTQRLPKLVGIQKALTMMSTGQQLDAKRAKRSGLVDVAAEEVALDTAAMFAARGLVNGTLKRSKRKPSLMETALEGNPLGRAILFPQAEKAIAKKADRKQYPAPYAILECIKAGIDGGHAAGSKKERELFVKLADTPTSRALRGIFFGMTATKKTKFPEPKAPPKSVGVLGAGLMGAGIAQVSMQRAKIPTVLLKDKDDAGLARGNKQIRDNVEELVKKRRLSRFEAERMLASIVGVTEGSASWKDHFAKTDVVVEAVFEQLDVKHKVFGEMETIVRDDCILATNTSAIPIGDIAKPLKHPERVVGMHYFSPVDKMPLLEVIPHAGTSDAVTGAAAALGRKQGKTVIVVKDVPGFYVNRCLGPYMDEVSVLLREGVDPRRLDTAVTKFGFPMGPATLADSVGADVALHVQTFLADALGERMGAGDSTGMKAMVDAGLLGKKTGKGFYEYDKRGRTKGGRPGSAPLHPEAEALLKKLTNGKVAGEDKISSDDLAHRVSYRFIGEALRCLEDGIIASPDDGDIGAVFGVGFPPFLGGPFKYIDEVGADAVLSRFLRYRDQHGAHFEPPQILKDAAANGTKFRK